MNPDLRRDLLVALERPHRLGTIGGDLEEQLAHSASFSSVLAEVVQNTPVRGLDLGTGGGLPGVVLAAMWPSMSWLLVDMRTARAAEVERTVLRLKLGDRVEVRATEAQCLGHEAELRESFDVVVARAFGPSSVTAECAAGLVRVGGVFVVSEPPDAEHDKDRWNDAGLAALGFALPQFLQADQYQFAVLQKTGSTPSHVPRMPPRSNRGWVTS